MQVLSPTKRQSGGTVSLNRRLQPIINPSRPGTVELAQHTTAASRRSGTSNSNGSSADALSSFEEAAGAGPPVWRAGDRVVQMVNDYDREVVNGDLGEVVLVNAKERRVVVKFPPRAGVSEAGTDDGTAVGCHPCT